MILLKYLLLILSVFHFLKMLLEILNFICGSHYISIGRHYFRALRQT